MSLSLDFIEELLAPDPEFVFIPERVIDVICPLCFRMISYSCINTLPGQFHVERIKWFESIKEKESTK